MNFDNKALLINSLQNGDEVAYLYLVDQFSKRMYGYAIKLTQDHTQAEDILQNVFLRTWERRRRLSIKTCLKSYLLKSVYNEFVNQNKKRRSTVILEQRFFNSLEESDTASSTSSIEDSFVRIANEIHKLPPRCHEIFVMSKKEGLTNMEISQYLQVSIKTVEAQITKAFGILREKFNGKAQL